jgi:hypothetical protein
MLDLGHHLLRFGRDEAAKRESLEWIEKANARLIVLRNNFPGIPLYQYELANSYNSLANSLVNMNEFELARKKLEVAQVELDQLIARFADFAQNFAEVPSLQGTLLGGFGALAFMIDKDPQKARSLIEQAIARQSEALEISPQNPKYNDKLRGNCSYLAQILDSLSLPQEAEQMRQRASSIK